MCAVLGGGQQLQEHAGASRFTQLFEQVQVTEKFRYLGQQVQVIFIAVFRDRHREQQVYGFAVSGIERNGFFQADEGSVDLIAALDPAMWNSDAIAKPGAAQTLPGTETFKNFSLAQIVTVSGELFADDFQQAFFTAAVYMATNSFRTKQVT